jgi:hypothetical protein
MGNAGTFGLVTEAKIVDGLSRYDRILDEICSHFAFR